MLEPVLGPLRTLLDQLGRLAESDKPVESRAISELFRKLTHAVREGERLTGRVDQILKEMSLVLSATRLEDAVGLTLEALIALAGAERGFLVLVTEDGELEVVAARHWSRRKISNARREVSKKILRHVVDRGERVLLTDAMGAGKFADAESVKQLKLLSVLAVPLKLQDRAIGALYLENRKVSGVFAPEAVAMLEEFADHFGSIIRNARMLADLRRSKDDLEVELGRRSSFKGMIGRSESLLEALRVVEIAAKSDIPILIEGESGTGKELVAEAAHGQSNRCDGPFLSLNCAALPEPLLESELFGHEKGAFTGAVSERAGLFAAADGGTLFLDEVAELRPALQPKLLRVLQMGEYKRLGSDSLRRTSVRIISATQKNLREEVKAGRFRDDLFYRLNGVRVHLPPLREREGDIPVLVDYFIGMACKELNRPKVSVDPEAMMRLMSHSYPGNVRELQTAIKRAVLFSTKNRITLESLPEQFREAAEWRTPMDEVPHTAEALKKEKLAARARAAAMVERSFLVRALQQSGGNVSKAARVTGMNRSQFQQMVSKHSIDIRQFKS